MVVDLDGMFVDKFSRTHDAFVGRPFFHIGNDKADKTVALGFDALHDFFAVDDDAVFIQMHAERVGMQCVMACFCGSNQEFGRHTAHARAGRAEHVVFNQVNIVRM